MIFFNKNTKDQGWTIVRCFSVHEPLNLLPPSPEYCLSMADFLKLFTFLIWFKELNQYLWIFIPQLELLFRKDSYSSATVLLKGASSNNGHVLFKFPETIEWMPHPFIYSMFYFILFIVCIVVLCVPSHTVDMRGQDVWTVSLPQLCASGRSSSAHQTSGHLCY